ncbi:hypothetical protein M0802_007571 [Mischocyttarus mexicanus]|nr:hypothetical protein M0802_007571 [Mischocyttarus mexicanus]
MYLIGPKAQCKLPKGTSSKIPTKCPSNPLQIDVVIECMYSFMRYQLNATAFTLLVQIDRYKQIHKFARSNIYGSSSSSSVGGSCREPFLAKITICWELARDDDYYDYGYGTGDGWVMLVVLIEEKKKKKKKEKEEV